MIRPSRPEDAAYAVPLLYSAIGNIAFLLTGTDDSTSAMQVMMDFYPQPGNRLSYENVFVAELDGRPVGAVLMYHGSRMADLDQPLMEQASARLGVEEVNFPKEARDDEFYLDSIGVDPAVQGRGVGTALMQAFEAEAARRRHGKVALIVDLANERARRLYEAQGYKADGQQRIMGHMYDHMVKEIELL